MHLQMSEQCVLKGKPSSLAFLLAFLGISSIALVSWLLNKQSDAQFATSLLAISITSLFLALSTLTRRSCLNLLNRRVDRCFLGIVVKGYSLSSFSRIIRVLKCIGETDRDFRIDIYFVSNEQKVPDFLFVSYWFSAKSLDDAVKYSPAFEMAKNLAKLTGIEQVDPTKADTGANPKGPG